MPSRQAAVIVLTDTERVELEGWARRRSSAAGLALRSRIVLAAADGGSNTELAANLGISRSTVKRWRNRFVELRCDGLLDEPRPGRPRVVSDEQIKALITQTLESAPRDATHWSTRSTAEHLGLSQSMVSRVWRAFGLAPPKQDSWKLSKDPLFVEKVRDVVGLYLDPPERAVVCESMRKPRLRRSIAPRRCSRCCLAPRRGPATTTSVTALQACTRR